MKPDMASLARASRLAAALLFLVPANPRGTPAEVAAGSSGLPVAAAAAPEDGAPAVAAGNSVGGELGAQKGADTRMMGGETARAAEGGPSGAEEPGAAPLSGAAGSRTDPTLYVVGTAHLDTQWLWTIQDTIRDYVPATLHDNFARFRAYPDYVFSFEGAFRYMLAREYYPDDYERLKAYVAAGRWRVAGSSIDAGDTNIPSPESLIRHVLYGNGFFEKEFGRTSLDIFLPDCFGFGWALPTVARHCGLRGFSTQKLTWGSSVGIPFDIGLWQGVDGSGLVAALDPGDYVGTIREDLATDPRWIARIDAEGRRWGSFVGYRYFGVGDQGGAPDEESVRWLETSVKSEGPLRVLSTGSDQLARDLTEDQVSQLPRYQGELLMTRHGTGCYTSQAAMKRWNRRNEQLAAAAEGASVAADWLGSAPYPGDRLAEAWVRFLWHHHHDDITGTSTPLVYPFSWNDEAVSGNSFAAVVTDAVGAVSQALDTRARGVPILVFNPLAVDREDVVEAEIDFAGEDQAGARRAAEGRRRGAATGEAGEEGEGRVPEVGGRRHDGPDAVRVIGPDGSETPSQIVARHGGRLWILFLARVPSLGFAVFDVRPAAGGPSRTRTLLATESSLENARYRVTLDAAGDIASILDKRAGREMLRAPIGLQLLDDAPDQWPEWEISHKDIVRPPRERLGAPVRARVVERGPVRVALEVSRQAAGSTFTETIRLAAGGAGEIVRIDGRLDWESPRTLLKAAFPLASSNARATYDIGLGTIERGNDTERLYEVPAQQWADITAPDGTYGVSILEDSKYGWDKPDDGTIRLTLIHNPLDVEKDRGPQRYTYALAGHEGGWREGGAQGLAARLNQPLLAFRVPPHAGPLGRQLSFLRVDAPQVIVSAVKRAEQGSGIVVRLFETHGRPAVDVRLSMAAPIVEARELTGAETPLASAVSEAPSSREGGAGRRGEPEAPPPGVSGAGALRIERGILHFDMAPNRPRTIELVLAPPGSKKGGAARRRHGSATPRQEESEGAAVGARPRVEVQDGPIGPAPAGKVPEDLAARRRGFAPPVSRPLKLPFDLDVVSLDADRGDGDFDGSGHSLAGELLPGTIVSDGIRFAMGPFEAGARNAVVCRGQAIDLPPGDPRGGSAPSRLYLLAAARGGDVRGTFRVGEVPFTRLIQDFSQYIGQSQSLVIDGKIVPSEIMEEPYLKRAAIAWTGTHRHGPDGENEPYVFTYLFKYAIDLTRAGRRGDGPWRLELPDDPAILLLAAAVAWNTHDDADPAGALGETIATTRIRPKGGLSIDPVKVTLSTDVPGAAIHYTLGGLEPTLSDPVYREPILVDASTTVRARAFRGTHAEDPATARRFTFARPRPAADTAGAILEPGLAWSSYEGAWRDLGGMADVPRLASGVTEVISASLRPHDENFGLVFTGFVAVPAEGVYTFTTRSDDGSALWIDGGLVVDNDGLHGARERFGQVALAAGKHAIAVRFFQRGGDIDLDVTWEGPGIPRSAIPPAALSHPRQVD